MTRALTLAVLLLAAGAQAAEAPAPTGWRAWKDTGLEIGFRLSALSLFNAAPLAYGPFELGYRFSNGLRVRGGLDIFYYEGKDRDARQPQLGEESYSYEMTDLRGSVEYVVPLPFRLRPTAGLCVDLVSGSRQRIVPGLVSQPKIEAWSVLAPGAILGLDLRAGEHWSLALQGRYAHGFTEVGPIAAADLSWHYLF